MKKKTINNKNILKYLVFAAVLFVIIIGHTRLLYVNAKDLCDDAMISARYAANLAADDGLRYNRAPKDSVPVEGYSNFLWTVGMAEGFKRQVHPRVITAVMGGVCSILCVVFLGVWALNRTGCFISGLAASLVLATYLPFVQWSMQGLETPLFALLALLAIALAPAKKMSAFAYLVSALACMTRPDGLLVPVDIFFVSWFDKDKKRVRTVLFAFIFFLVPYAAYSFWRINHFDALVPNVFFAKTGLGLAGIKVGARYMLTWAIGSGHVLALLLVSIICAVFYKRTKNICGNISAPVGFILVYFAFIISVGGDFMPDHRFVMHVVPLIIGCGMICLGSYSKKYRRGKWLLALFVFLALTSNILGIFHYHSDENFSQTKNWRQDQAKWYGKAASWLLRNSDRSAVIACGDIGYIGFVTDAERIVDTNGLVDRYLARYPGAASLHSDPDYVVSQSPDFIVVMVHYFENGAVIGHNDFDRKFLADKNLREGYVEAAELSGWKSTEYSFSDGMTRTSLVRFKIFKKINRRLLFRRRPELKNICFSSSGSGVFHTPYQIISGVCD